MNTEHIRNFSIIAHVDHGKSTLSDRLLERTGTIPERKMRDQVLDRMDLERERGITIKMTPVRMAWNYAGKQHILNLIDTPGHIDFSYEVSRALTAVEGVVLLVDATQGIQAQTLTTLTAAKAEKCVIIPVISKIDSPLARVADVNKELSVLLNIRAEDIIAVSGKTGEGVDELLQAIIKRIPPPRASRENEARGLVFDFSYSAHRGISVCIRVFDGVFKKGDSLTFRAANKNFVALETGVFTPDERITESLSAGEIGYIVTGIKEPGVVGVGDTIGFTRGILPALPGYDRPRPVVWASVYLENQDDLPLLRQSLEKLRLSDSSISFEEESSGIMGKGFRCGFLGLLHLEIVTERLRREFGLTLVVTIPTISYSVTTTSGVKEIIYTPAKFPDQGAVLVVEEPWTEVRIISPATVISSLVPLLHEYEAETKETDSYDDGRIALVAQMPLRELMRGFFDKLKSVSAGYASLSYKLLPNRPADVTRLDVLIADELVPAFTRIVARRRLETEAEKVVERLHSILPKQLFVTKIQARANGRIISSRTLSAMRKDVTGYLYGGDVTRKMKLLEKQKRGKKKMLSRGRVNIPEDVFMKMMQESKS